MTSSRSALWVSLLLLCPSLIQAVPSPSTKRVTPFTSNGCYVDNANNQRALTGISYADNGMTVESCGAYCAKYQYFGVEYGRECYCGNSLTAQTANSADCSFPCAGNSAELCGAGNRLNVYTNTGYQAPEPASLAEPYLGCYIDGGNPRVLPDNLLGEDDMTAALCLQNCAEYSFFGLEYGRECWCGNSRPANAAPATDCSFTCAGDDTEICGAGGRINVWFNPDGTPTPPATVADFSYLGCYTDINDQRSLTGLVTYDPAMTLEKCAAACAAYPYFGVEFGSQCYCGTALEATAQKSPVDECTMRCGGNPDQVCGESDRLNVYANPAHPGTGGVVTTATDFSYLSCWTDDVNARSLPDAEFVSDAMTVESCAASCHGYNYFGLEFSNQCYCGYDLGGQAAPEAQCGEICVGNPAESCGGGNYLNVYELSCASATW